MKRVNMKQMDSKLLLLLLNAISLLAVTIFAERSSDDAIALLFLSDSGSEFMRRHWQEVAIKIDTEYPNSKFSLALYGERAPETASCLRWILYQTSAVEVSGDYARVEPTKEKLPVFHSIVSAINSAQNWNCYYEKSQQFKVVILFTNAINDELLSAKKDWSKFGDGCDSKSPSVEELQRLLITSNTLVVVLTEKEEVKNAWETTYRFSSHLKTIKWTAREEIPEIVRQIKELLYFTPLHVKEALDMLFVYDGLIENPLRQQAVDISNEFEKIHPHSQYGHGRSLRWNDGSECDISTIEFNSAEQFQPSSRKLPVWQSGFANAARMMQVWSTLDRQRARVLVLFTNFEFDDLASRGFRKFPGTHCDYKKYPSVQDFKNDLIESDTKLCIFTKNEDVKRKWEAHGFSHNVKLLKLNAQLTFEWSQLPEIIDFIEEVLLFSNVMMINNNTNVKEIITPPFCSNKAMDVLFLENGASSKMFGGLTKIATLMNGIYPNSSFAYGSFASLGNTCKFEHSAFEDLEYFKRGIRDKSPKGKGTSALLTVVKAIQETAWTGAHQNQYKLIILLATSKNDELETNANVWTKDSISDCKLTKSPDLTALENYLVEMKTVLFVLTENEESNEAWSKGRFTVTWQYGTAMYDDNQIHMIVNHIDELVCHVELMTAYLASNYFFNIAKLKNDVLFLTNFQSSFLIEHLRIFASELYVTGVGSLFRQLITQGNKDGDDLCHIPDQPFTTPKELKIEYNDEMPRMQQDQCFLYIARAVRHEAMWTLDEEDKFKVIIMLTNSENDFRQEAAWTGSVTDCLRKSPTVEDLDSLLINTNTVLVVLTENDSIKHEWESYGFSRNVEILKFNKVTQIPEIVDKIDKLLKSLTFITEGMNPNRGVTVSTTTSTTITTTSTTITTTSTTITTTSTITTTIPLTGVNPLDVLFLTDGGSKFLQRYMKNIAAALDVQHPTSKFGLAFFGPWAYYAPDTCYDPVYSKKSVHEVGDYIWDLKRPVGRKSNSFLSIATIIQNETIWSHVSDTKVVVLLTNSMNDELTSHKTYWKRSITDCSSKSPSIGDVEELLVSTNTVVVVLTEDEDTKRSWEKYDFTRRVKVIKWTRESEVSGIVEQIDHFLYSSSFNPTESSTNITTDTDNLFMETSCNGDADTCNAIVIRPTCLKKASCIGSDCDPFQVKVDVHY